MTTFSQQVDAWCRASDDRLLAIAKESTQRTVSKAQSRIPIDTGFARASVRASLQSMPPIMPGARGAEKQTYSYNSGDVAVVISGLTIGATAFVGWTASYSAILETGSSKQAPTGFVGISAMEWPQTVAAVVSELKSRAGAGQ